MRTSRLPSILLALVAGALVLGTPAAAGRRDEVADLVAELSKARDDADAELITQLADIKTRAAMEGLLEVYERMGSIFMKLQIVRALATFDGVGDAEQPALQKILDVATDAKDRELRDGAVDALGGCRHLGKDFLRMIVESPAQDEVRERAMDRHVALSTKDDHGWYRVLFETEPDEFEDAQEGKKKGKKDEAEPERRVHHLESIRERAFAAIVESLEEKVVEEAAQADENDTIRGIALRDLHRRDNRQVEPLARRAFEDVEEKPENRVIAARVLAELNGAKEAGGFIEMAQKFITPEDLRTELARILAGFRDEGVDGKLSRLVGKGKPYEKRFALMATVEIKDDALTKKIRRGLQDKDPEICVTSARALAARGDVDSIADMRELIEKATAGKGEFEANDPEVLSAMVEAVSLLAAGDEEWNAQLLAYAQGPDRDVRNAALAQLAKQDAAAHFELFVQYLSHPEWSTRLEALRILGDMRTKDAVGPIIARMPEERGRMLHEFADVLWILTGEPFRTRAASWQSWWADEEDRFQIISEEELGKRAAEEEERRLRQISNIKTEFFGIRIVSERVIFVIDTSGSMAEATRGEAAGEVPLPRIEVAKRELTRALESLEENTLFNIITFSSGVTPWLDSVAGSSQRARDEAYEWVSRLGAGGATNLYGALEAAFEDPDVDTLVVLSDGEPTGGETDDPYRIREVVQGWNENRGVVMHTIAVGGSLQILEWIAEDSGGSHVKFR